MSRPSLWLMIAAVWPILLCAEPANHLDQLLLQVQKAQQQETVSRREREKRFLASHADQKEQLSELKVRLAAEHKRSKHLRALFDDNEETLSDMEAELKRQTGDLGEVFGTVRQTAKDLTALISESLVSAQYPERAAWLRTLSESKRLPDVGELERLWYLLQQETVESGMVVRFPSTVIDTDGYASEQKVVRVGLFNALAQGRYLNYQPDTGRFVVLERQPTRAEDQLTAHLGIGEGTGAKLAIDPTRGVLLSLLVQTPDLAERIHQGGIVGYVILVLGGLGLLIVIVRLVYLAVTGWSIRHQLRNLTAPSKKNPLGRILTVAVENPDVDPGNLELQVDEAILRELPRLTRGEGLVKLLAGVAPLLGLLGTVTGMIATFQAITLFGTGDPKMMADGISQALVTTALGLIVAIPLLFMHTLISSRSQALVQILDEQSLGLVAAGREERCSNV
ncbi:MotA/TolQ/ExbB proton channel family protein [hydrothermal vent metagenome]|uniref:MotA/TolQ/ExbB proton channel family protein n=1 Tax=hydrothermal vent metagenome TaxID=652676 RepID=A0A3B1BAW1_9ZZZZ